MLKDDRSPLYLSISKEEYPRIFATRKFDGQYGPYLNGQTVKSVLRFLRRIFPYRTCKTMPRKTCLYFDLKLCPGLCVKNDSKTQKEYLKNIAGFKSLIQGKKDKVIKDFEKEMKRESRNQNYEKALEIKRKISELYYLYEKRHFPREYLENPNLVREIREKELINLKEILQINSAERIEGYDISNLMGKNATGSLVVFINGEAEKSQYRRFRIRLKNEPDDLAMIKEVLRRRFKHREWPFPSVILVDGGRNQVKTVLRVLKEFNIEIPVFGLAKKEEKLIVPLSEGPYNVITLKSNAPALNLVKRIRDESHRFAKKYHLQLREKIFRKNV